ncbi:MAG: hypothetical protein J0M35_10320 [Candidatus Obscuribacter phosphatis]|uniref:Lipoprotein n=1 Tax=Candidatus Obscuribacter phosphatis TaxID=1906157 RepID=A0A8J7P7I1_9BACT|nr:hypothetical protein [Candidatus Obscuribacter phosphatis]
MKTSTDGLLSYASKLSGFCVCFLAIFLLTACSKAEQPKPEAEIQLNAVVPPQLSIDAVRFDTTGLTGVESAPNTKRWTSGRALEVSLRCIEVPPDIPCSLSNKEGIRDYFRRCAIQGGGGLVEADVIKIGQVPCAKTIVKVPQQPSGTAYVGSITIPLAQGSYVIRVQSVETGITGMRESAILHNLTASGKVTISEGGVLQNWERDPYDPKIKGDDLVLRNQSEDERYDKLFPTHPLTRVRVALKAILRTIKLDKSVLMAPPFLGP